MQYHHLRKLTIWIFTAHIKQSSDVHCKFRVLLSGKNDMTLIFFTKLHFLQTVLNCWIEKYRLYSLKDTVGSGHSSSYLMVTCLLR